ncbi:MAG: hypothetical protein HQM08_08380 [Candidatus Riflebacteria bacterium]|nr:hypothetical protein [Candidatus Riflebacteria bacterium]
MESFLAGLPRPTPFTTFLLLVPEKLKYLNSRVELFFNNIVPLENSIAIIDQKRLFSTSGINYLKIKVINAFEDHEIGEKMKVRLIPKICDLEEIYSYPVQKRVDLARDLFSHLNFLDEFWITLPQNEISVENPFIQSADFACVLISEKLEEIVYSYELIKSLHRSGFFSPFIIFCANSNEIQHGERVFERLQGVARQFLSLDLLYGGMLISSGKSDEFSSPQQFTNIVNSIEKRTRNFFLRFSESFLKKK